MKRTQNLKESSTADLHESIIINILIFLPVRCIIRCRCVCKAWATLISQPCFIKLYDSTKKSGPVQLLIEDRLNSMAPNNLFWAQLDEAASTANSPADFLVLSKSRFPLKFLDEFPDPSSYKLKVWSTCSVTGYIAAAKYNANDNVNTSSPVSCHIFNPVTGHHILVDENANSYRWDCCALLYVEKTNQFKLLYFHGRTYERDGVDVEIQAVGSSPWRSMGTIPFFPTQQSLPTLVNGLYHWIDYMKPVMYSFNAEDEEFQQVETPPGAGGSALIRSHLGLMNGCLCICVKSVRSNIDLWVMSESGDGKLWTKKFVLCGLGINIYDILQPLICLENGDVVILDSRRHAICYNPTTRSRKYIRFGEKERSLREAEAIGLKEALSWIIAQGYQHCVVETDSHALALACNGRSGSAYFGTIVDDCLYGGSCVSTSLIFYVRHRRVEYYSSELYFSCTRDEFNYLNEITSFIQKKKKKNIDDYGFMQIYSGSAALFEILCLCFICFILTFS